MLAGTRHQLSDAQRIQEKTSRRARRARARSCNPRGKNRPKPKALAQQAKNLARKPSTAWGV